MRSRRSGRRPGAKSAVAALGAAGTGLPRRGPCSHRRRRHPGRGPAATSEVGAPAAAPSAGAITLLTAETAPRKSFYYGYRAARLRFTIGSTQAQNDLRVAARGGIVQYSSYQSLAGNYIAIDGHGTPIDFVYAHLAEPSPLQTGEAVRTGQPIGVVGKTGDATACHLHFEMWSAPGWYQGGSPFVPLPYLEEWDTYS